MALEIDPDDEQIKTLLERAEKRLRQRKDEVHGAISTTSEAVVVKLPQLETGDIAKSHIQSGQYGSTRLRPSSDQREQRQAASVAVRKVEDPVAVRAKQAEKKKATAGQKWFDLPKTDLTPELKRDLQILKMRNVLDPHRHYKKDGGKMEAPKFSQIGTIIEGPTEYYSARVDNKSRKRTFVEEVLAGEQETGRFKRKYGDVQTKKSSGKKGHYKALQAKRTVSFKRS